MLLSLENYTLVRRFGDKGAIDMAKAAGFDAVDYSFYWNSRTNPWPMKGEQYADYARSVREHLKKTGMVCNQAHAHYEMGYGREFSLDDPVFFDVVRSMECAAILGAKAIVVHPLHTPPEVDFFEYNRGYYLALEPFCEKFGIQVAIENLYREQTKFRRNQSVPGTPAEHSRFVNGLNREHFCACVDVGHASLCGYEAEEYLSGMERGVVKALHLHDTDYLSDKHALPFTGNLHWHRMMAALKSIGYDGDFTMEAVTYLEHFPKELLADALALEAKVGRYLIRVFQEAE